MCYNKTCMQKQPTPYYISFKIGDTNCQCLNTVREATRFRINQELKFIYIKKQKLNEQLYKIHLECAAVWQNNWQLMQSFFDEKLKR